jgi:tetraacyldisaccharide 4'-kinase
MNLGPIASPLAGLFGLGVLTRRLAYDCGLLPAAPAPLFTVSVGGLEVGGTGKTPVTEKLLRAFVGAGRTTALLTRGYGRRTRGLVLRAPGEPADPAAIGDEPAMLVQGGLDVRVAASERRAVGMSALRDLGVDTVVMDDAFSHRAQARNVDIVVLRGEAPFGNGHLMPWGSLREPPSSLARAHVVWLHFRAGLVREEPAWWRRWCGHAVRVVSQACATSPTDVGGRPFALGGRCIVAAAGIADPDQFFRGLEALGAESAIQLALPDHARFDATTVAHLNRLASTHAAAAVVVTPKDAVKLKPIWHGVPLVVVGTRVEICEGAAALALSLQISPELL